MKDKYEPPKIYSFREGFSADHSHECYGCRICGPYGEEPFLKKCEECGEAPFDSDGQHECFEICDELIDDFCQVMDPVWCVSHHYVIKYESEGKIKLKRICPDCFEDHEEYPTFRYCSKCQAYVKSTEHNMGCPYCGELTVENAPNYWEKYKQTFGKKGDSQ